MTPFLVHIVFHPQSDAARELARSAHRVLNGDPVVPGLRIPTRFTAEDTTNLPPIGGGCLNDAEKVFVLVLADDKLNIEYKGNLPEGRKDWGAWIADLYEACEQNPHHRCVPFQLSEFAWPLDDRLRGVNFPRVWRVKEVDRAAWMEQRLVIELVRFLQGEEAADVDNPSAPLQAFVSHAKIDLNTEPKVVEQLKFFLTQDKPVDAWFDSGDIEGGSRFAEKIEEGVRNSVLLSVLTDAYGSREWCRKEVLLAKTHKRPVVVIDALQNHEVRSFPYMGNVPVLRWADDPQVALHLLFKETLRQLHARLVLEQQREDDEEVLTSTPELSVVVGHKGKKFLYPDPPLGQEELDLIAKSEAIVETPLQRFAKNRPLAGIKIALSLSESGELERYGLDLMHLDQAAIEISRYLLLAGATLCYGGNLGDEGYTVSLFELVHTYPMSSIAAVDRIVNYVGWPLPLTEKQEAQYRRSARFRLTPRPTDVSERDAPEFVDPVKGYFPDDSALRRFAWARGMTVMRETQTQDVQARVVLGGKTGPTITALDEGERKEKWYKSRIPGVLEEILMSLKADQPVYLVGGFGGCARMVADLILGNSREEMSWDFQKQAPYAPEMRQLYEKRGVSWWSYDEMTTYLKEQGIEGLGNKLSVEENKKLFETVEIDRIVALILQGLRRLKLHNRPTSH